MLNNTSVNPPVTTQKTQHCTTQFEFKHNSNPPPGPPLARAFARVSFLVTYINFSMGRQVGIL